MLRGQRWGLCATGRHRVRSGEVQFKSGSGVGVGCSLVGGAQRWEWGCGPVPVTASTPEEHPWSHPRAPQSCRAGGED